MDTAATNAAVAKLREFNRFYLPAMELLGDHYPETAFSVPECRLLHDIYHDRGCSAAVLAKRLRLDKSYLSRILRRLEKQGLLRRVVSQKDARVHELYLTAEGVRQTEALIASVENRLAVSLAPLTAQECEALEASLEAVIRILRRCSGIE